MIRPFRFDDADYAAHVVIKHAVWPEYRLPLENYRQVDRQRDMRYEFQRFVMEHDGQVVAIAHYQQDETPGKYGIHIEVQPEFQGQGYGRAFYDYLVAALCQKQATVSEATTHESQPSAIQFLTRRGFVQTFKEQPSKLDVPSFDAALFAESWAQVVAQGIQIINLRELQATKPNWKHEWWALEEAIIPDLPYNELGGGRSFEAFEEYLAGPAIDPTAFFFALDRERLVGLSGFWVNPDQPKKLENALTGVLREYRRRGIALALKLRGIEFAKAYGAEFIETRNEENNPMYQINLMLGFKPIPAWLIFEKRL